MSDGSKPLTAQERRDALFMEKLFTEIDEEEVKELTAEQVDAELRGLGIDPAELTPAKVLARVRFRFRLFPELAQMADVRPHWRMGGEPRPVAERVQRLLEIEEEIAQERNAAFARLTPEQLAERVRAAGLPFTDADIDALLAHARRRASSAQGNAAPAEKSARGTPGLRLVKPSAADDGGRGGEKD